MSLRPEDIDGMVFWSKNPQGLLAMRAELAHIPFYVQYTLNAYGEDIEPGVPPLDARVETFRRLAQAWGPRSVCWRYDPILFSHRYGHAFHVDAFGALARSLQGSTDCVTVSFLDLYRKIARAVRDTGMCRPDEREAWELLGELAPIAREHGMAIATCAESQEYGLLGVEHAACIDARRLMAISGRAFDWQKDKNQRPACGCARAVDIGSYGRCAHGCAYCYAKR